MRICKYLSISSLFVIVVLFSACVGDGGSSSPGSKEVISTKAGKNEVDIHELGDFDKIQPVLHSAAATTYICGKLFQTLLTTDTETFEPIPLLAVSRPKITLLTEGPYKGGMTLEFEIRPEAKWDNGTPITGLDYLFTIKSIKNPKAESARIRPYFDFIKDVVIDKDNPKKFTVYSDNTYILSEESAGYWVLPEYIYDPNQVLRKFSIKDLNEKSESLRNNKDIVEFSKEFNSEKFSRDKGFIVGSGPYTFEEWKAKQYVVLKKKENWWAEGLDPKLFANGPEYIRYKIMPDWTTAITALKAEEVDLARSVRAKDFVDLKDSEFKDLYSFHTPDYMAYEYIGMNMKSPIFSDKKVRQAMRHIIDKKLIREVLMYGYGLPVIGPFHPSKKYYNKNIADYGFDLDKATKMLDEAGWKDTDQDGIRDKVIDGKKTPFKATIKFNQGNTRRENTALMLSENAKKIGLDIQVQVREWTVFIDETKSHDFDMYVGAWVGSTSLGDPTQIWHSESYNGGSNYVGFGNAESDALIDELKYNLDEPSRTEQYKRFQEIIHEEAPYIFLNALTNKLAFHKRFDNAKSYVVRPGYEEAEWLINPKFGFASGASK